MRKLLIIFLLSWSCNLMAQQFPLFNSFTNAGFIWNPALTAPYDQIQFGAMYRQEWLGFDLAPRTITAFVEYPFVQNSMSVGGFVMRDEYGTWATNSVGLNYAYHLLPNLIYNDQLTIGISGKLFQHFFDGTNAIVNDQSDVLLINSETSALTYNFGVGILYSSKGITDYTDDRFFLGIGSQQILPQSLIFDEDGNADFKREIHGNLMMGYRIGQTFSFIEPAIFLNYAYQNVFHAALRLLYEKERAFWGSLQYHTDNTVILSGGAFISDRILQDGLLKVGIAGGYNISPIGRYRGLTMEFILSYLLEVE